MLDLTAWQSASELNLVWGTSNDTMYDNMILCIFTSDKFHTISIKF